MQHPVDILHGLGRQATAPVQASAAPRVLAALGPKMLELAAERADGAHTYLVTPEHTVRARAQLGPAPWLVVEQAAILERDAAKARAIGRRHMSRYLDLRNYTGNFRRLGFTAEDITNRGSDRLVDVSSHGETSKTSPHGSTITLPQAPIRCAFRSSTLILMACRFGSGARFRASLRLSRISATATAADYETAGFPDCWTPEAAKLCAVSRPGPGQAV
jgi:hypothetical protein